MERGYYTVRHPGDLRDLVARLAAEPCVAFDTEFVWERTYYARLGLIQLALQDGSCFLIDVVALADVTPLGAVMADPRIEKILHDGPQDLTILRRATGVAARNVFDTRLAAGFAGLSSETSLQNLLADLLGVQLSKAHTRANWLARPLSVGQLDYAAADVRHLPQTAALLRVRAREAGVESWLDEELRVLGASVLCDARRPGESYLRIRAAEFLTPRSLAVLRELAAWREKEAITADVPRGHIAGDSGLVSVARALPRRAEELAACRDLAPLTAQRWGAPLLAAVERGMSLPDAELPPPLRSSQASLPSRERVAAAMEIIRRRADARRVDWRLVGSKSEVALLLQEGDAALPENHRLLRGWRAELLDDSLSAALAATGSPGRSWNEFRTQ